MPTHAIAAVLICFSTLIASSARAQGHDDESDPDSSVSRLAMAISAELAMGVDRSGARVFVRHCRRAPGGCEARARELAALFVGAGERHGVDPYTLAAMALKESGYDSRAVGRAGELGLMQLHPRSRWGRDATRRCNARDENGDPVEPCDFVVVDEAAALLARATLGCGDVASALGAYNSASCGVNEYARRVLRIRERLLTREAGRASGEP